MIYIKTDAEVELLRESALLVSKTLAEVAKMILPGVTTLQLDRRAEEYIRDNGAVPAFLGYAGFPNTLCTSVNEMVVHGIPNNVPLQEGDIVSLDCGVLMNGFYGDSAYTFAVGEISEKVKELLNTTKESLSLGIKEARNGERLGNVGNAIQNHCQAKGFSVVREMVGHGVGKNLHEEPNVPNYGKRGSGVMLKKGMVLAIEPMINMGRKEIVADPDGWNCRARDRKPSAHFEKMVAIGEVDPIVLTSFDVIEEALSCK
ncbi:MAG TPA: type I methionyl aminopeptidase [Porphyromonadaceae bacterium]|nr:type I methionyl aminopeptidase [Porphyromonadaceae bacterium]